MTSNKRTLSLFLGSAVILTGFGVGLFFLLNNSGDDTPKELPFETVEQLFARSGSDGADGNNRPGVGDGIPAADEFAPFTNIAPDIGNSALIENRYPGVAIFDYDRDGDLDFYVTSAESGALFQITRGGSNKLFRNEGNGTFADVAEEAGVALPQQNSSAVAACDINNDGYQDLYVAGHGRIGDGLDYRSIADTPELGAVMLDRIFLNQQDGTFEDITVFAVGQQGNVRSAMSVSCADVDNDGWLDIFVGNRADQDFVRFDNARHHGQFNVFYRNNGDLTFTDLTVETGLVSPQIKLLDSRGVPITFAGTDGRALVGFDPSLVDANNRIAGDPAGQTWASMFFDYDDDGDADLWIADDGDVLKLYRNDTENGVISFTSVGEEMGIGMSGQWMGFALGDLDGDADLDVFVTNMGFHRLSSPQPIPPGGDCAYSSQLGWGTCYHMLLENDGAGGFRNIAGEIDVQHSEILPPESLNTDFFASDWTLPEGLEAYEFGFGTAFFDMENDGDDDLYWLGSLASRGEGPNGNFAPAFGRLLQNTSPGFKDVTIDARVVDALGVDYSGLDSSDSISDLSLRRLGVQFHENGKGVAIGDLNGDGFPDMIATNSNGESFDETGNRIAVSGPLFVWINGGGDNRWVTFQLRGRMAEDRTGSNADAIGARLTLVSRGLDGQPRTQVKEVLGSSSFLSMSSLDVIFGLGSAESVESLTIRWPSGIVQVLEGLAANTKHQILEPAS